MARFQTGPSGTEVRKRVTLGGSANSIGSSPSMTESFPPRVASSVATRGRSSALCRRTPPIGCPRTTPDTSTCGLVARRSVDISCSIGRNRRQRGGTGVRSITGSEPAVSWATGRGGGGSPCRPFGEPEQGWTTPVDWGHRGAAVTGHGLLFFTMAMWQGAIARRTRFTIQSAM